MTVSDDSWGDMAELDDRLADRLLDGTVSGDDVLPSLGRVATLVRSAQTSPTPEELAGEAQIVTAMQEIIMNDRGRRGIVGRALVAKAVAVATLGGLGVAAAAATGGIAGLWFEPARPDRERPVVTAPRWTDPTTSPAGGAVYLDPDADRQPPADPSGCGAPADPPPADHVERLLASSCVGIPPVTPSVTVDGGPPGSEPLPPREGADPDRSGPAPPDPPQTDPAGPENPPGAVGMTPGQSGTAPGVAGTTPGQAGTAPGVAGTTPGQAGTAPGVAGTTPGQAGTAPGVAGTTPGQAGEAPSQSESPRGPIGTRPDRPEAVPGSCRLAPGPGGCVP
jgi:hypothetical protein